MNRWLWVVALFVGIGMGVLGDRLGKPEPALPAPIHVEAAVAASKWEDERYKRLEGQLDHRMERLEDRINHHSEMIDGLSQRASLHRHVKSGQACGPFDLDAGECAH